MYKQLLKLKLYSLYEVDLFNVLNINKILFFFYLLADYF